VPPFPLSPAFAEAATRRQAVGEREGVRGDFKYLWLEFISDLE